MYLTKINTTYYYHRKTPKSLSYLFNTAKIKRSLSSNNRIQAKLQASEYTLIINKALVASNIGLEADIVTQILRPLLINKEPVVPTRESLKLTPTIVEAYLDSVQVSEAKLKVYKSRLSTFTTLINNRTITPTVIDDVIKLLQYSVPKRHIPKYKGIPLKDLLDRKYNSDELLGIDTINTYLIVFKSLLRWAFSRELISKDYSNLIIKVKSTNANNISAKDKTTILTDDTIDKVLTMVNPRERTFIKALRYSGLRPSELLQAEIIEVDDILCFDLTGEGIQLKNKNSRRVIPIHSKLLPILAELKEVLHKYKTTKVISRNTTKALRELGFGSTATLYSIRHTFINSLINLGAEPNIVSSLVGHSLQGNTMTMGLYFKGYTPKILQEAIEQLR